MKFKRTIFILLMALVFNGVFSIVASAETTTEIKETQESKTTGIRVDINGHDLAFNENTGYPFVDENERTLVPFRITMESYGCTVSWNEETKTATATKDGTTIEVPVGEKYIKNNGFEFLTDTAALQKNNRLYLPIRAVAEAFGAKVAWNQKTQNVIITAPESTNEQLTVHFINVGHGDSIFINYGKYEILIDGGVTSNGALVSDYIKPYVDDDLDLLIVTHSHMDHVGGLPEVFARYQVDRVIESGSSLDTPEWQAYNEALNAEANCIVSYDEDEVIPIAEGITLKIIEVLDGQVNENNNSVAALLTAGNVTVLLAGDSQSEAEAVLLQKVGKTDVFKGDHHGSFNANSKELFDVIKPEYIVISAGKGINYNHPHVTALKRMLDTNATIYGTFKSGTIVMTTNGNSYSFSNVDFDKILIPLRLSDAGTYQKNIDLMQE